MTEQELKAEVEIRVAARKIANMINADSGSSEVLSTDPDVVLGDLVRELIAEGK